MDRAVQRGIIANGACDVSAALSPAAAVDGTQDRIGGRSKSGLRRLQRWLAVMTVTTRAKAPVRR